MAGDVEGDNALMMAVAQNHADIVPRSSRKRWCAFQLRNEWWTSCGRRFMFRIFGSCSLLKFIAEDVCPGPRYPKWGLGPTDLES